MGIRHGVWALAGLCLTGLAAAGEPSSGGEQDSRLALAARQALVQDPALARLNLGVTVHERVATLWGLVPSVDLARRAAEKLRSVAGLHGIRNDLQVETPERAPALPVHVPQPVQPAVPAAPVPRSGATPNRPLFQWQPAGGTAVERVRPDARPPTSLIGSSGAAPVRPQARSHDGWTPVGSFPAATSVHKPVEILPAIPIATQPSAAAGPSSKPALREAIALVQRRQPRFLGIQVDVRGGLVFLQAPPSRSEDVFLLAGAVADLPGVERVILKSGPVVGTP